MWAEALVETIDIAPFCILKRGRNIDLHKGERVGS